MLALDMGGMSDKSLANLNKQIEECEQALTLKSIVIARREAERLYLLEAPDMAVETPEPENQGFFAGVYNWWYGGAKDGGDSKSKTVTRARLAKTKRRGMRSHVVHYDFSFTRSRTRLYCAWSYLYLLAL